MADLVSLRHLPWGSAFRLPCYDLTLFVERVTSAESENCETFGSLRSKGFVVIMRYESKGAVSFASPDLACVR